MVQAANIERADITASRSFAAPKLPAGISIRGLAPVAATVGLSIAVGALLISFRHLLMDLGAWGYAGVFFVETANSAAVLVPTPSIAYTLTMSQFLNPVLVGVLGGAGSTIGELVGYMLGNSGRRMVEGSKVYGKMKSIAGERIAAALFIFALLPVPFDFAGIWAGTVKYPVVRFLIFVGIGKTVKFTAIAFAGHYGISFLLNMVG